MVLIKLTGLFLFGFIKKYYFLSSSSNDMGICLLKASLKEMIDSVLANPNGCNLSWIMLSRCWLFFAYILMNRSYCPVV